VPTYAYACTACDHRFEIFQSFSDDSLTECPQCEGRLRKLFNAVGVVFKGGGFYRTDSRQGSSSSPAASGKGDSGSSGSRGSGGTGKGDSGSSAATSSSSASSSGGSAA
jgi:putative FmdB family regulatory protein